MLNYVNARVSTSLPELVHFLGEIVSCHPYNYIVRHEIAPGEGY